MVSAYKLTINQLFDKQLPVYGSRDWMMKYIVHVNTFLINNLHRRLPLKIHVYTKSLWTHGSHIRHCHPHSPAPSHTSTSGGYTLQTHYTWTLLYSLKWGKNINHLICWLIICNVIMNYHCVTLNASCLMWFRGWTFTWSQFKLLKGKLFIIRRVIFQWLMKID